MATHEVALQVRDVDVHYGRLHALSQVNLELRAGEALGLLGANGAGKTTLLNTLSGFLSPSAGSIHLFGTPVGGMAPHRIVRKGLLHVSQERDLFGELTVLDNLRLGARGPAEARFAHNVERVYGFFPRLKERATQRANTMSGGEQQMLAMARALMGQPRVLLLDEPSMGLSPIMVDKIFEVVSDVSAQGVTVLLVEQNASRALAIADRGYVMESGIVTMEGPGKALLDDPKVRAAYLGE